MVDYMAAALGMVIIFVAAVFFLSGMVTNGVAYSVQRNQALDAQNLFDYMLLNPGSPANWGTNYNVQPSAFGLAQPNSQQYTLSPADVLRLMAANPVTINGKTYYYVIIGGTTLILPPNYYVNYTYVKKLLGIAGRYEFQLTLTPALNVTVTKTQNGFLVTVKGYGGAPMPSANVTALLVYAQPAPSQGQGQGQGNSPLAVGVQTGTAITDASGQATLTMQPPQNLTYYLLVQVSAAGIKGAGYYTNNQVGVALANISVFPGSNYVNLTQHCAIQNTPPCGVDNYNVTLLIPSPNGYSLTEICWCPPPPGACLNPGQGGGNPYSTQSCQGSFYDGFIAVAISKRGASSPVQVLVVPISPMLIGVKLTYGYNPQGASSVSTLTRIVEISGITYVAQLAYWPDVGPVYGGY